MSSGPPTHLPFSSSTTQDPTPGWRTGSFLIGFLMSDLDENWFISTPWCLWSIKVIISIINNTSVLQGSNSKMVDGVFLTGFLMSDLDEIWNVASLWCLEAIKMIINNTSVLQGSNSKMVDGGVLDGVPDVWSWWNLKCSISMMFKSHQDDHQQHICPSRIQLQDGGRGCSWRGSWCPILMKFET